MPRSIKINIRLTRDVIKSITEMHKGIWRRSVRSKIFSQFRDICFIWIMGMKNSCMIVGILNGWELIKKNYLGDNLMLYIRRNCLDWIFHIKSLKRKRFSIKLWRCLKLGGKMLGFWDINIVLFMKLTNFGVFLVRQYTRLKMKKIFSEWKNYSMNLKKILSIQLRKQLNKMRKNQGVNFNFNWYLQKKGSIS